jgi:ankyrin repeat protein
METHASMPYTRSTNEVIDPANTPPKDLLSAISRGDIDYLSSSLSILSSTEFRSPLLQLALCAIDSSQPVILAFLVAKDPSSQITVPSSFADSVSRRAVAHHSPEMLDSLLAAGLDSNYAYDNTGDLLITAVRHNRYENTKLLLDHGVDVDNLNRAYTNYMGPLAMAANMGLVDMATLILERGAPLDQSLALQMAARGSHLDMMRFLLERGADINENPEVDDRTYGWIDDLGPAIHSAAGARQWHAVKYLLDRGADVSLRDHTGRTVLERGGYAPELKSLLGCME